MVERVLSLVVVVVGRVMAALRQAMVNCFGARACE